MYISQPGADFGVQWTRHGGNKTKGIKWHDIAYGGGNFIAVPKEYTISDKIPMVSPDGENWTLLDALPKRNCYNVAYGAGTWYIAAEVKYGSFGHGPVLVSPPVPVALTLNGDLIATETNLQPLFKIVNDLSAGAGGVSTLDELTDVNVPSPNVGDTLVWDGTEWVSQAPSGGAVLAYQDLAPASPEDGDLWFNTSTLKLSVYHGNAWVQIGA